MIGLVHGSNLWQTTYSFSPSSASIMPTEAYEALDKYQPEYVVVWGKRLWDKMPGERWQDGEPIVVDGRLSPEQRQTCGGNGGEPSFRRLFVGLLVSCAGKILLALNGGKNNAGFRNEA